MRVDEEGTAGRAPPGGTTEGKVGEGRGVGEREGAMEGAGCTGRQGQGSEGCKGKAGRALRESRRTGEQVNRREVGGEERWIPVPVFTGMTYCAGMNTARE